MTREEALAKAHHFLAKEMALVNRIVKFSRTLIAVLEDAQRLKTAEELKVLYFELDANQQDREKWVEEHVEELAEVLSKIIRELP